MLSVKRYRNSSEFDRAGGWEGDGRRCQRRDRLPHSHQKTPTGAGRSGGAGPALACGREDEARVARSQTDAETLPIFSTGLVGLLGILGLCWSYLNCPFPSPAPLSPSRTHLSVTDFTVLAVLFCTALRPNRTTARATLTTTAEQRTGEASGFDGVAPASVRPPTGRAPPPQPPFLRLLCQFSLL